MPLSLSIPLWLSLPLLVVINIVTVIDIVILYHYVPITATIATVIANETIVINVGNFFQPEVKFVC